MRGNKVVCRRCHRVRKRPEAVRAVASGVQWKCADRAECDEVIARNLADPSKARY